MCLFYEFARKVKIPGEDSAHIWWQAEIQEADDMNSS